MSQKRTRSGFGVMMGLIGMIRPMLGIMCLAILMGCVGNLMASFITILGGYGFLPVLGLIDGVNLTVIFVLLILFALLRGILRYAEQASNHYIAFKLLARIRHKVFAALRKLAPAKLDGSEKGNLISIITSDIELLEVFYAHTISPIVIAVITSLFMVIFLGRIHPIFGAVGLIYYLIVGALIPIMNGKRGSSTGQEYRNSFGELNTCVLDNLYGLEEILQFGQQETRQKEQNKRTEKLHETSQTLKDHETIQKIVTDGVILSAGVVMAILGAVLLEDQAVKSWEVIIAVITIMSSFGPTAALSTLSNNLHHTLAAGNRVLDLLEEEPVVEDVAAGAEECQGDIVCDHVTFAYENEEKILDNFSGTFSENKIHGILGKSGCGKSTLLKLLMRFYETDQGTISYGKEEINRINTKELRNNISYVTQETFLFQDTIANNIKIAREDASMEEVIEAAKKASIHDFIMSTPEGYDTKLAELGDSVSGGEKQRIGIARAFLHNSKYIFLDEPTSNIDSLNEGMILRSLDQEKKDKTIILVSHRKSTMGIADEVKCM
ncbi:MAG: ABC transporter ATP-binding protein [Agathobacter sp.]|nr:ABC transporter ATP-binding protein [Agathobacter sp.]